MDFCRHWALVMIVCLGICFVYSQSMRSKKEMFQACSYQLSRMEEELNELLDEKEYLELKIASQDDPAWIEMVLMRDLGVVPEGYLKVHFNGKS